MPIRLHDVGNASWNPENLRRHEYGIILGKNGEKRSLGQTIPKLRDDIKLDLTEILYDNVLADLDQ
jgi:hypothetical protein